MQETADAAGTDSRADFLAVMSHEMRTPLNGIIGLADLLLDAAGGGSMGETERHYVEVIRQSGERLLQMVNDTLDFSRLDAGQMRLEETAFDLRAVTRSAIELLQASARAKGLALELVFGPELPVRAGGDPARLRQVLLNLVGNAVKFTEQGQVRVAVAAVADSQAELRGAVRLQFEVSDTGIGIAPDRVGSLFDEFVQGDGSISRRYGGSGLGLAISQRLVAAMGGTISVESQPGEGSRFRFDVVLRARRASDRGGEIGPATQAGPKPMPPLSILVAEDNATNRLVVMRMLERQGHRVTIVDNGAQAVAALRQSAFDLVLMDVMMPEMDGLAATMEIRRLPAPAGLVPIIGLTAGTQAADAEACDRAGMNGHAPKPITAARLAEAVAGAIGHGQAPLSRMVVLPVEAEHRGFDPAMLDAMVRDAGSDAARAAVAGFLGRRAETLARLRALAANGDGTALVELARHIAHEAAGFGLMRAARAGLDLAADSGETEIFAYLHLLSHGLEELRAWQRSTP